MEILTGKVLKSNSCDDFLVIEELIINKRNYCKIRFINYPYENIFQRSCVLRGEVFNPLYPSVYNKGYLGIGKYNYKYCPKYYDMWIGMFKRCYNTNNNMYKYYGAKGIIVDKSFYNFQDFCSWFENQSSWNINNYDLVVDKDIKSIINKNNNKVYSEDTCLVIPFILNLFLSGDGIKMGVFLRNNGKYFSNITRNSKRITLGTFDTFKEAKEVYAKKKQEFWIEEVNKFDLPNNLREILLQYDFSWSWLLNNMTEEEIREKYYTK